jgi:hypothetical protein
MSRQGVTERAPADALLDDAEDDEDAFGSEALVVAARPRRWSMIRGSAVAMQEAWVHCVRRA